MLKKDILITQSYDSPSHSLRRSHSLALPKSMGLLKSQQDKICHLLFLIARCSNHPAATPFLESGIDYWNFISIFLYCELITYMVSFMKEAAFLLFVLPQSLVFQIRRTQLGWIYLTVSNFQWNLSPFWSWQAQRLSSYDIQYLIQKLQNSDFQLPEK